MTVTMSQRLRTLVVPIVAVAAIVGSGTWMVIQGQGVGGWSAGTTDGAAYGMMDGTGFGGVGSSGDRAPVVDLAGARDHAQAFATDLRPGLRTWPCGQCKTS